MYVYVTERGIQRGMQRGEETTHHHPIVADNKIEVRREHKGGRAERSMYVRYMKSDLDRLALSASSRASSINFNATILDRFAYVSPMLDQYTDYHIYLTVAKRKG